MVPMMPTTVSAINTQEIRLQALKAQIANSGEKALKKSRVRARGVSTIASA